jgi:outer membrane receptor protein involved in Fe transport
MNTTPLRLPARLLACGLSLVSAGLFAQTAPAPAPGASDTITLSPFEVSANSIRGYVASETMTGSRVKVPILDLPYTVNVMTSEFFKDFGVFELSDNLTQISGFSGLDVGGNFNLRGFSSSNQLRDGFFRLGRYGSSNIDRMEIIKGSSAAIYGRTSPGGMVNMISKSPKDAASQSLSYNFGDYGTQRTTLEATGPFFQSALGKTRYIFTGSYFQRDFNQDYARNRNHEYYAAVDHVFADNSKLFFSAEYFLQIRHAAPTAIPLIVDQKGTTATTDDVALGYALNLGKYNYAGPNSELVRGNTSLTSVYEKTFNPVFSTRISGNCYRARRWDFNYLNQFQGGNFVIRPASITTPVRVQRAAVPTRGRIYEDGGGFQGDLLAHYWTHDRKIEHRTLATLDINDYYQWNPTLSYAAATNPDIVAWNTARYINLDANLDPIGPWAFFPKWARESPGEVLTRSMKKHTTTIGGSVRQQTALFRDRLLAYAGLRYDRLLHQHRDRFTAASSFTPFIPGYTVGQVIRKKYHELKPNAGLNYKVTPGIRVFANYSESFFIDQGDTPLQIADPNNKPETADGWDYGLKGSLLNDKFTYTLSGYYINRQNVRVTDLVETPAGSGIYLDTTRNTGAQLVRGYEADVNWQVTPEFFLLGSYGNVHSIYTDYGTSLPAAVGRKVQYIAPYNGSVNLKFAPTRGTFKGFSANVGVTFVGATPTEAPNAGDTYVTQAGGKRVVTYSTGQWALRAPAYRLWSAGLRYQLQGRSNTAHTFALNVNNLFDKEYLRAGTSNATRLRGEDRAVYFTYTINHKGTKL